MTSHDARAVIARSRASIRGVTDPDALDWAMAANAVDALTAAGLAVVAVDSVPPWMLPGSCIDCGCGEATWGPASAVRDIYVTTKETKP